MPTTRALALGIVVLTALMSTPRRAGASGSRVLTPGRAWIETLDGGGRPSASVLWHARRFQVTWERYLSGSIPMWHPQLVSLPRSRSAAGSPALFEATNQGPVYWGAPLRIVWLAYRGELLVRLIEISDAGSPAYAACLRIATNHNAFRVVEAAEVGRERGCPSWAQPLMAAEANQVRGSSVLAPHAVQRFHASP